MEAFGANGLGNPQTAAQVLEGLPVVTAQAKGQAQGPQDLGGMPLQTGGLANLEGQAKSLFGPIIIGNPIKLHCHAHVPQVLSLIALVPDLPG